MLGCPINGGGLVTVWCMGNPTYGWEQLGRPDALAVWSQIVRFNWLKMAELLQLAEGIDSPAGTLVRATLQQQIAVLAEQMVA